MRAIPIAVFLLLLAAGCTIPDNNPGAPNASAGVNGGNGTGASAPVKYGDAVSFFKFTDPHEGAFSLEVPQGWSVTNGSGLVRPYIDAAVAFEAKSPSGQGFMIQDPYGYVYEVPNPMLDFAGFKEGSLYDPSGGISNPMMVRSYVSAADFSSELIQKSGINVTNVKTTDRPDLVNISSPMIAGQSASETRLDYSENGKNMSMVLVISTTLVQVSGTGVWYVSGMEYYSPKELMNETELLALGMQRSFKVDAGWAARENKEVQKRLGIISQAQSGISATISSVFETRSSSMDELNHKWDNAILGIEDVYNPSTGDHYVVDSGSNYYWIDNRGTIYGTQTDQSPFPQENMERLSCPGC